MRKLLIIGCLFLFSVLASAVTGVIILKKQLHVVLANNSREPVLGITIEPSATLSPSETPIPNTPTLQPTVSPTASSKAVASNANSDLVSALTKKYGVGKARVDKQVGSYAQGSVGTKWWLAVNSKSGWQVVEDGVSYPNCATLNKYQVPSSLMPVCWGSSGFVNR